MLYLEFVFFHLINYFTTTFIRNSLNSLVLLNLFSYDLLYFTFVFLDIIVFVFATLPRCDILS